MKDNRFDTSTPLFKTTKSKHNKVKVDERFQQVLKDKRFLAAPGKVDKYGRKVKNQEKTIVKELSEFYEVEDDQGNEISENSKRVNESSSLRQSKGMSDEDRLDYLNKLARGEIEDDDTSSDSDDDSDNESDDNHSVSVEDDSQDIKRIKNKSTEQNDEVDGEEDDYKYDDTNDELPVLGPLDIDNPKEIETGDATHRLSVLNCDWENIRAQDLMAVLQSFCPVGKNIQSVTIYVSDYGKEQMEKESKYGVQGIWYPTTNNTEQEEDEFDEENEEDKDEDEDEDGSDDINDENYSNNNEDDNESADDQDNHNHDEEDEEEEEEVEEDDNKHHNTNHRAHNKITHTSASTTNKMKVKGDFIRPVGQVGIVMHDNLTYKNNMKKEKHSDNLVKKSSKKDENVDIDEVALRRYELNKLRYYFAIVVCDSVNTADILYKEVDGIEMENSAMVFDLRFVPDDISFDDREIKDICDITHGKNPLSLETYTPPDFIVQALQHTKVECSWDKGEKQREKLLTNISSWKQLNESDLLQYVADSNSEDEDQEDENEEDDKEDSDVDHEDNNSEIGHKKSSLSKKQKKKAASLRKLLLGDDIADDSEDEASAGNDNKDSSDYDDDRDEYEYDNDDDDDDVDIDDDDNDDDDDFFISDGQPTTKSSTIKPSKTSKSKVKHLNSKDNTDNMELTYTYIPDEDDDDKKKTNVNKLLQDRSEMTPLEVAQLKLSEKRKARKLAKKQYQQEQEEVLKEQKESFREERKQHEKKSKNIKNTKNKVEEKDINDSDIEKEDYNMRTLAKQEKLKEKLKPGKKNKRINKEIKKLSAKLNDDANNSNAQFSVNLQDDRFSALLEGDSRYGIDPTSTLYKATEGMKTILQEQRKRKVEHEEYPESNTEYSKTKVSKQNTSNSMKHGERNTSNIDYHNDNTNILDSSKQLADKLKKKFGIKK